jgi:hypothetical protein
MNGLGMTGDISPLPIWLYVMYGNKFTFYASINHPEEDSPGGVSQ